MTDPNSPIIEFFSGGGADAQGRTLDEICQWSHPQLEAVHDYIQWLFPLPEPSAFNHAAPLLTDTDIAKFRASPALRERLLTALTIMLGFYGFSIDRHGDPLIIRPGKDFPTRATIWLTPGNHNFLRISRILRCLSLLGLQDVALAWLSALEVLHGQHKGVIGSATLGYWQQAVR